MPQLVVPREVCTDYARSSKLEWLETAGDGSFAMGTVAGTRTRRYHGLLVASQRPPVERSLLLAGLDEFVRADGAPGPLALSTQQYPNTLSPSGFTRLLEFRLDPYPTWIFDLDSGAQLTRQLFMLHGEQTVIVTWRATHARTLTLFPYLACRDYHSLGRARAIDGSVRREGASFVFQPEKALPELRLHASPGAQLIEDGAWYYNAEVLEEQARGMEFQEDLWKAGTLTLRLEPGVAGYLAATTGARTFSPAEVEELAAQEAERRRLPKATDPLRARLERAAGQFCVQRADRKPTVIAGYPWFTDWGRDTMLSLPGLYLARGHFEEARGVLRSFLEHLDQGLIPNRFPDRPGEPLEYNTADATLWMFQAVHAYLRSGGAAAAEFLRSEFYPAAREIIRWHERGTHHQIHVDRADHLLSAGERGSQLTWMDARVRGEPVTPRAGKPVEINALWFNALRLMSQWASELGDPAAALDYRGEADLVAFSFERAFWNPARGYLNDVIPLEGPPDTSLRPNQILAVALPFPLLEQEQRQRIVQAVERELLTEVGLRTLSRGDAAYQGQYQGNMSQRDGAYHQGTVWPWLLGPYARAYLCAHGRTPQAREYCRGLLYGLEARLDEGCLGQVGEVFDGDSPHLAGGAPAQAWSVAQLLELLWSELAEQAPAPQPL